MTTGAMTHPEFDVTPGRRHPNLLAANIEMTGGYTVPDVPYEARLTLLNACTFEAKQWRERAISTARSTSRSTSGPTGTRSW